jgi:predicted PurR-regulated permease PerM
VDVFGGAASVLSGLVVVLFVAFYLAANPAPVIAWVVRLLPPIAGPAATRSSVSCAPVFWTGSRVS